MLPFGAPRISLVPFLKDTSEKHREREEGRKEEERREGGRKKRIKERKNRKRRSE